jgi:hypothetical protein
VTASRAHDAEGACAFELTSEFASVLVFPDQTANGPRLRIENRQNGRVIFLDPLELATLTWLRHDDLAPFLDPSRIGWSSDVDHQDNGDRTP